MRQVFYDWTGRIDEAAKGKRIHQVVENTHINEVVHAEDRAFGIVGFESDEGVRRNKGRMGAKEAPNQIRKMMGSIPYHSSKENLIDVGNVTCDDGDLEIAQVKLAESVAQLIEKNHTPIILGGGHETFFGHYLGVRKALGADKKIGLVNLDAHLDMRLDEQPSSGTMFRQILETDANTNYLCIGLQELGNTEQLFATAKEHDVTYIMEEDLEPLEETYATIDKFASEHDVIIYTICSDVINQAHAPGVSAPAPFGIHPNTVRLVTEHVITQDNFISFDISEVNPSLDIEEQTSRLASYIVSEVLSGLNHKGKPPHSRLKKEELK